MLMRYARVSAGTVAEIITIAEDGPPLAELYHPDIVAACVVVHEGSGVAERWSWDGEAFSPPPEEALPSAVPDVTARQLRLWVISQGRALSEIDAAIAALPEEARPAAQVEWEYATVYQRAHPLIGLLAPGIGLTTPEAIDQAFREAAIL